MRNKNFDCYYKNQKNPTTTVLVREADPEIDI